MTNQAIFATPRTTDSTTDVQPHQMQRVDASPYVLDPNAREIISAMRGDTAVNTSLNPISFIDGDDSNPLAAVRHTNPNPNKSADDGPELPSSTRGGAPRIEGVRHERGDRDSSPGCVPPEAVTSAGYDPSGREVPHRLPQAEVTVTDVNGNPAPTKRHEEPSRDQLDDDLGKIPLTKDTRKIAEDLLEAIKGGKDSYIVDDLSKVVKENSDSPEKLKKAAEALNKVFEKYGIVGPIVVEADGTLKMGGGALVINPDGTYKVNPMHASKG